MNIQRMFLLILACIAGASASFAQVSQVQTLAVTSFVAGGYRGLLTGTSGPGGIAGELTVRVEQSGEFTAALNLEGRDFPLIGKFAAGNYSGSINTGSNEQIGVSLSFTGTASLSGTVNGAGQSLAYAGAHIVNNGSAGNNYRFIISPGELIGSGSGPEGTGYGDMYVRESGVVSIAGRLPDGQRFSTESFVTSGTSVPVYAHLHGGPAAGIAGVLVFQDVPNVSDCHGTLYWYEPPQATAHYPDGFELATQYVSTQYNRVIGGLYHNVVTFTASGADLQSTFSTNITLIPYGNLYYGDADTVHLVLARSRDRFYGHFEDPTTHLRHTFDGVLLVKSRTGAGLFVSQGLGGTVSIQY